MNRRGVSTSHTDEQPSGYIHISAVAHELINPPRSIDSPINTWTSSVFFLQVFVSLCSIDFHPGKANCRFIPALRKQAFDICISFT